MSRASAEFTVVLALKAAMEAEKLQIEADDEFAAFRRDSFDGESDYYRLSESDKNARDCDMDKLAEAIPRLRKDCHDLTKKAKCLFVAYRKQGSVTLNVNHIEASCGDERSTSALRLALCVWDCAWNPEEYVMPLFCLGLSNKTCFEHFARRAATSHLGFNRIRMLLCSNAQKEKELTDAVVMELD
jgi:hypothetical protein